MHSFPQTVPTLVNSIFHKFSANESIFQRQKIENCHYNTTIYYSDTVILLTHFECYVKPMEQLESLKCLWHAVKRTHGDKTSRYT